MAEHTRRCEELYKSGTADAFRAYLEANKDTTYELLPGRQVPLIDLGSMIQHLAQEADRPDLAEVFVERLDKHHWALHSAAMGAARFGHAKLLRVLLPHVADVDELSTVRDTILAAAARHQQLDAVRAALAARANPDVGAPTSAHHDGDDEFATCPADGNWPLVNAVRAKNETIATMLLDAGANPNLKTANKRSVLDMAEEIGHTPMIELLRARGAKPLSLDDLTFDEAAEKGATKRMLELAPDASIDDVLTQGGQYGRVELLDHAATRGKLPQKALDKALYYAAQNGHAAAAKRLIALGANPQMQNDFTGASPLVTAVANSNVEIVRALLSAGASTKGTKKVLIESENPIRTVSLLAIGGGTRVVDAQILHDAAYRGNLEIVKLLVDAGADVNQWSKNGGNPLDVAIQCGHEQIIAYLEGVGAKRATTRLKRKPAAKAKKPVVAKKKSSAKAKKPVAAKKKKPPVKKKPVTKKAAPKKKRSR